jgi:Protein of unknown function (DUF4446)
VSEHTTEVVAIAAGAIAIVGLAWAIGLTVAWRRLQAAQRAVLGGSEQDLVAHAAHLQASYETLAQYVEDFGTRLDTRVTHAETRLDGAIAHRGLVRYDAYGEMSGRQSTSLALLDTHQSGVVLSTIHHRDHARLYAKQVHRGKSDLELSPEEIEAIALALRGDTGEAAVADAEQRSGARGAGFGTGRRGGANQAGTTAEPGPEQSPGQV